MSSHVCSGSTVHRLHLRLNSLEPVSFYAYKMETFRSLKMLQTDKSVTLLHYFTPLMYTWQQRLFIYGVFMICDLSSVFRVEIWLWSCSLVSCCSSSSLWSFFLLFSSLSISSSASSSCLFSTFSLRVNCKSSVKRTFLKSMFPSQ